MKKWLQRLRGAIGTGLTWAVAWSPIGALTGLAVGFVLGAPLGVVVVNYVSMFAVLGFIGGSSFSTILRLAEGRRRFDELSLPRFTAWGALGGLLLGGLAIAGGLWGPGLTFLDAIIAGATTLLGAGSAAGSLTLARRVSAEELLEAGESAPEARLRQRQKQRRLGGAG